MIPAFASAMHHPSVPSVAFQGQSTRTRVTPIRRRAAITLLTSPPRSDGCAQTPMLGRAEGMDRLRGRGGHKRPAVSAAGAERDE